MIIEIEDRFCKAAKLFSKMLNKVQRAAERGDAMHEVEEMTWGDLIETGRETIRLQPPLRATAHYAACAL